MKMVKRKAEHHGIPSDVRYARNLPRHELTNVDSFVSNGVYRRRTEKQTALEIGVGVLYEGPLLG